MDKIMVQKFDKELSEDEIKGLVTKVDLKNSKFIFLIGSEDQDTTEEILQHSMQVIKKWMKSSSEQVLVMAGDYVKVIVINAG